MACSGTRATPATEVRRAASAAEAGYQRVMASTKLDGRPVADGPDARATVVVVFASWCGACRRELATLAELEAATTGLRVIGVNAYEDWGDRSDAQRLRAFLTREAPWLEVVRGDADVLRVFGGVPKIPSMFVYDREGRAVAEFRRDKRPPPRRAELRSAIDRALDAAPE